MADPNERLSELLRVNRNRALTVAELDEFTRLVQPRAKRPAAPSASLPSFPGVDRSVIAAALTSLDRDLRARNAGAMSDATSANGVDLAKASMRAHLRSIGVTPTDETDPAKATA